MLICHFSVVRPTILVDMHACDSKIFSCCFEMLVPGNVFVLRFLETLEVIGRSGRWKGGISPSVHQHRRAGFRVMTKTTKNNDSNSSDDYFHVSAKAKSHSAKRNMNHKFERWVSQRRLPALLERLCAQW